MSNLINIIVPPPHPRNHLMSKLAPEFEKIQFCQNNREQPWLHGVAHATLNTPNPLGFEDVDIFVYVRVHKFGRLQMDNLRWE